MFMLSVSSSRFSRLRRVLPALACSVVASLGCLVSSASATSGSPYGQIARFGGYDGSGKELGKFVLPVGFAVDPGDGNAVYVLDRVIDEENGTGGTLQYRLQKLSSAGVPLASVLLPVQHYTSPERREGVHPLIGLAVDSAAHVVYALVQNIVGDGGPESVPVVERLVAWSTEPQGKELVPAPGYKTDSVTGGGLVAGPGVLEPAKASEALYLPQTLTVDHNHNIVIEAEQGVKSKEQSPVGGPMILQQVKIEEAKGEKLGVLGEHFIAESVIAPENQVGGGLYTTQNGSLGLDMWTSETHISTLATVQASIQSKPEPMLIAEDKSNNRNRDAAMSIDNESPIAYTGQSSNSFILKPYAAGSPVAQLTNGLYAARYAETFDSEQGNGFPNNRFEIQPFWYQGKLVSNDVAREGVRLFSEAGKIATTLGAEKEGEPCYVGFAAAAIAAGEGEAVFVLDQPNSHEGNKGDEVIELAPDADSLTQCPTDSREVEVDGKVSKAITVAEGAKVSFGVSLSNPGADTPFEFEWNFGDGSSETKTMEAANDYAWPERTVEHRYPMTPGVYHASLRVYGAFGTSEIPVTVTVAPATPPAAVFSSPGGAAEEEVDFDASGSTAPGGKIEKYEWNFGDGGRETSTPEATVKHAFAKQGSYSVTLKVVDGLGRSSEVTHTVAVSEGAKEKTEREEREAQQSKTTGTTTTTTTTPPPPVTAPGPPLAPVLPPVEPVKPKVLTSAQKLAIALKVCRKEPKQRRAACIKQAEKKYGHKAKKKKKK